MDQRLPARVYWVRRVLVLVVLVGVGAVVVLGLRALTDPAPGASPTSTPGSTATSTLPGGIADCDPSALRLTVAPTAASFPDGVSPGLTVTIANDGSVACLVDAGEQHALVTITSGEDRVWSSQDCAPADAPARTLLLAPGKADTRQVAWNLLRSAPGCPEGLPTPGAGTYVASFTVGGAQASPAPFVVG
ncbi:MAG: hypothetical protein FWD18_04105 [Micrococcales bacterium]|nr:hypothetical protein [Micrococcales bacterium]